MRVPNRRSAGIVRLALTGLAAALVFALGWGVAQQRVPAATPFPTIDVDLIQFGDPVFASGRPQIENSLNRVLVHVPVLDGATLNRVNLISDGIVALPLVRREPAAVTE